ncbi:hypothetical protein INT47_001773 [Mucor saturninus]|uniref:Uncharacterized protein n=1 Tax=Mucor saturninus TaxID=64648 RepID=A0A8H7RLJ5_9FUNG|nr:hypothetical protein INT47_001773 [Mucor saturninus]
MTTPCLTRQNAFLVEDYEVNSPLDWFCSICCQVTWPMKSAFLIGQIRMVDHAIAPAAKGDIHLPEAIVG